MTTKSYFCEKFKYEIRLAIESAKAEITSTCIWAKMDKIEL